LRKTDFFPILKMISKVIKTLYVRMRAGELIELNF
jgi:hypothetical protein